MNNCERCNKESDELQHYFIHPSDDHNEMYLCRECIEGLWSFIHGTKLENEIESPTYSNKVIKETVHNEVKKETFDNKIETPSFFNELSNENGKSG